ncbi:MAG: putative metal-binding motif-containing protein [Deltaproteobacteria bacterium]|nr:putative metal-binding motif-containing protein [Deltaproteobacteria bacterium]
MTRWLGTSSALLLAGCWMSQAQLGEAAEDRDGGTSSDTAGRDSDSDGDDDAGGESSEDDGRDDAGDGSPDVDCRDADGDGHPASDCGGDDCDDADPDIYPGAPDACGDGRDTNCDGLDPSGDGLLGPKVLLLDSPSGTGNAYTALLWTGREYLFVWRRIGFESISLIRLDTGGKLLGDETAMRHFQYAFDSAWSGNRLGTAWGAGDDDPDECYIWFQTFDASGRPLLDAVRISNGGYAASDGGVHYGPRIAAAGDDFFVVWSEMARGGEGPHGVWVTRVGPDGTRRFDPLLVDPYAGGDGAGLELAWTGSELGVVRGEPLGGTPDEPRPTTGLRLRRLGWSGEPLGPMQVVSDTATYSTQFQLLWTGTEFAALWNEGEDPRGSPVMLARLDAEGHEVLRASLTPPLETHFPEQRPAVWTGRHLGAVWAEHGDDGWRLTLRRFELSGAVHGPTVAVPTPGWPGRLDIAWTGSEFGFTWSEETTEPPAIRVYFQRATFCDSPP